MAVYFAEAGPYMKIGYSADPTQRMTTVTRNGQRPHDLPFDADADLIGWIPGDRRTEAKLHRRFANIRVEGEWFWSERAKAVEVIWQDPRGVDIHGMSALAAMAMLEHPGVTRDDLEAIGLQVVATSELDAINHLFAFSELSTKAAS